MTFIKTWFARKKFDERSASFQRKVMDGPFNISFYRPEDFAKVHSIRLMGKRGIGEEIPTTGGKHFLPVSSP